MRVREIFDIAGLPREWHGHEHIDRAGMFDRRIGSTTHPALQNTFVGDGTVITPHYKGTPKGRQLNRATGELEPSSTRLRTSSFGYRSNCASDRGTKALIPRVSHAGAPAPGDEHVIRCVPGTSVRQSRSAVLARGRSARLWESTEEHRTQVGPLHVPHRAGAEALSPLPPRPRIADEYSVAHVWARPNRRLLRPPSHRHGRKARCRSEVHRSAVMPLSCCFRGSVAAGEARWV